MNMSDALKALSSHAPSSTLTPTWPLKSARPRLSRRPARVTSPAPVTTPRIPSRGRVDTSDGRAEAVARAICAAEGRMVKVDAAIGSGQSCSSILGPDGRHHGKSRPKLSRESRIVQCDFHRDTLHDLCVVAGGIVGRQQCEL